MMSLWDALRMNMMISYQELVRTFLSELLSEELTAKNSLKKNINFWFNECGLSKSEVINEVINWKNFAYTLKELEEAKNEAIRELRS
ncbi:hypothetical protein [Klebsiella pneumoniae]|uniref:hypothetical protein n=1 Tax=Klebsiella pneumoniae TaxID=573 RepID=UPI0021BFBDB2|nr:hypothetical protein [Klebsiella pneumoniae]MCT9950876.1 hypothetical protein [Klebsiella pneumoniae]